MPSFDQPLNHAHDVACWNGARIPAAIGNDAKCAAIAEKEFGSLKNYEDAIFLIIGTGVGGAVYLNGKLLRPKRYSGFEVGHTVINKDGIKCSCGRRGCFEVYSSMRRLKEKISKEFNLNTIDGIKIREFIEKNKDKIREQAKKRYHNNYKLNTNIKLIHNQRNRINKFISGKNKNSLEILNCDINFFKKWIQFQFDSNMTWENYGKYWHIDHYIPCSKYGGKQDLYIFHWKNLRPCEKIENLSKNNKIPTKEEIFIHELNSIIFKKYLKF